MCDHLSQKHDESFSLKDLSQLTTIPFGRLQNFSSSYTGAYPNAHELGALTLAAFDYGMTQVPLWKNDCSPTFTLDLPRPLTYPSHQPYNSIRQTPRLNEVLCAALKTKPRDLCTRLHIRSDTLRRQGDCYTPEQLARVYLLCSEAGLVAVPLWVNGEYSEFIKIPCLAPDHVRELSTLRKQVRHNKFIYGNKKPSVSPQPI